MDQGELSNISKIFMNKIIKCTIPLSILTSVSYFFYLINIANATKLA